jgi:hypothetical protein
VQHAGKVLTHRFLLNELWGDRRINSSSGLLASGARCIDPPQIFKG